MKRYDIDHSGCDGWCRGGSIEPDPDGDYFLASDVVALVEDVITHHESNARAYTLNGVAPFYPAKYRALLTGIQGILEQLSPAPQDDSKGDA
jgi:hypothetical protein